MTARDPHPRTAGESRCSALRLRRGVLRSQPRRDPRSTRDQWTGSARTSVRVPV